MKKIFFVFLVAIGIIISLCSCNQCVHSWEMAGCDSPKSCTKCGITEGEAKGHSWREASCTEAKTCASCGLTEGTAKGHSWTSKVCTEIKSCTRCHITSEIVDHVWENEGCSGFSNCTICGKLSDQFDHKWISASCDSPKTCQKCGKTEGKALEHNWVELSCKEPKKCSLCGETTMENLTHAWVYVSCDAPRECSACQVKESEPVGHSWREASCTEAKTCTSCSITEGEELGHNWQEASCKAPKTCLRCEETQGGRLMHNWQLIISTEPICEDGRDLYACSYCSEEYEYTYPATRDYHICTAMGTCIDCNRDFDLYKMTLDSILLENIYSVEKCGIFSSTETDKIIYKPITSRDIGMPVIDLGGDISAISKNNSVNVSFSYEDTATPFECYAEIKVQGASSASYPKKNFSIKLLDENGDKNKVKLVDEWGKAHKYCMKANYIDFSQSRNVVSAKIFGEIVRSRNDELYDLPNGGAIDGYPILVYNNGTYLGVYTMNIPKDKWMFDMEDSDEKNQAIFMAETWNDAVSFRQYSTSGFELEFASNEESEVDSSTQWAYDSILRLISFVMNNNGEDFKNGIHEYADIDKCIDSMLYTFFICADDNISKNILWVTLDGKVWFSSMYDMDGTWGMRWNGNIEFNENTHPISAMVDGIGIAPERNPSNYNLLWEKIYINFFDRVCERYWELRQEILTLENITAHFESFFAEIPDIIFETEKQKWTGVPSQSVDHLEQILTFAEKRIEVMDKILIPEDN